MWSCPVVWSNVHLESFWGIFSMWLTFTIDLLWIKQLTFHKDGLARHSPSSHTRRQPELGVRGVPAEGLPAEGWTQAPWRPTQDAGLLPAQLEASGKLSTLSLSLREMWGKESSSEGHRGRQIGDQDAALLQTRAGSSVRGSHCPSALVHRHLHRFTDHSLTTTCH